MSIDFIALVATIFISVTGAATILSYRIGRLESAITELRLSIGELRIDIRALDQRIASLERRVDQSSYVPKGA